LKHSFEALLLRDAREKLGLNKAKMAAVLGVTQQFYGKVELGSLDSGLPVEHIKPFATATKIKWKSIVSAKGLDYVERLLKKLAVL